MANWTGVVTNAGAALLASWVQGEVLTITSAAAGTGTVSEAALMAQTALKSQKQTMSIVRYDAVESGRRVKLQLTAPETGYTLNQIGIWAKVGTGTPAMLAIYQNATGVLVPDVSEAPEFVYAFYATIAVSNEGEISITIDPSAVVTESTLEEYVEEYVEDNAVSFNTEQELTEEQQEQAAENIGLGDVKESLTSLSEEVEEIQNTKLTNRNLLDNPWFTVNQREIASGTPFTSWAYSLDRWMAIGSGALEIYDDGIKLPNLVFAQKLEPKIDAIISDSNVVKTFSVMYSDKTVESVTFTDELWKQFNYCHAEYPSTGYGIGHVMSLRDCVKKIRAVKLELGSVSTLSKDAPPNYAEELLKCQRYFHNVHAIYVTPSGELDSRWMIPTILLSPEMRAIPTTVPTPAYVVDFQSGARKEDIDSVGGTGRKDQIPMIHLSSPAGSSPRQAIMFVSADL